MNIVGVDKFKDLLQLHAGEALIFVVDTTGSMSSVVGTIRQQTINIINLYNSQTTQPYNYILVTFNDIGNAT